MIQSVLSMMREYPIGHYDKATGKIEMAAEAFRLFLRSLKKDSLPPLHVRLATELVVRNSTDPDVQSEWDLTGW